MSKVSKYEVISEENEEENEEGALYRRDESIEIEVEEEYIRAKDEWDNIKPLPIINLSQSESKPYADIDLNDLQTLTHQTVDDYFKSVDITDQMNRIKPTVKAVGIMSLLKKMLFLGPPSLKKDLVDNRDRIFAIALKPFDNTEPIHCHFLTTIYQKLTNQPVIKCPRFGNHWEEVGFQGTDPATDLRGVGLLGLHNLLFLILSEETQRLARDIFKLSVDKKQNFPFSVMGTNITQIALQSLREGVLNKEMNASYDPFHTFGHFYCGLYLKLYNNWRNNKKSIAAAGFVLKELKLEAKKSPRSIIEGSMNYEKMRRESKARPEKEEDGDEKPLVFSSLGNVFDGKEDGDESEEGERMI